MKFLKNPIREKLDNVKFWLHNKRREQIEKSLAKPFILDRQLFLGESIIRKCPEFVETKNIFLLERLNQFWSIKNEFNSLGNNFEKEEEPNIDRFDLDLNHRSRSNIVRRIERVYKWPNSDKVKKTIFRDKVKEEELIEEEEWNQLYRR